MMNMSQRGFLNTGKNLTWKISDPVYSYLCKMSAV